MREPEIALVFTPEPWVEELHRHLTDHGGARVRQVLLDPDLAREESYDTLVVSPRWPALTRGLVDDMHARGRRVLGVHDRDDASAHALLQSVGVDAVVTSDAGPRAFVDALREMQSTSDEPSLTPTIVGGGTRRPRARLVVLGGQAGSGRTEVAVHLAWMLGERAPCVVVDADDVAPSIAPRLGLAVEPNLRSAIDAVEHGHGDLAECTQWLGGRVRVVTGLPNAHTWSQLRPAEVLRVLRRLAADGGFVVADAGVGLEEAPATTRGRHALPRALVGAADVVVAVARANPVGITRLLGWIADARQLTPRASIVAVINHAPSGRFKRGELYEEVVRTAPVDAVVFVPPEARVVDAMWSGHLVHRRRFQRAVRALADEVRRAPNPVESIAPGDSELAS